jgi:hypothetical protein
MSNPFGLQSRIFPNKWGFGQAGGQSASSGPPARQRSALPPARRCGGAKQPPRCALDMRATSHVNAREGGSNETHCRNPADAIIF